MFASFKLPVEKLDNRLLKKIKTIFPKNALIEIKISDDWDETEYLLSTSANRMSLMKSIDELNNNQVIFKTQEELNI